MRLIISCHGGSESTKSPSISLYADRKDLGMDNQGASVRFSVARRFRHVLLSYNSREYFVFLIVIIYLGKQR
jgi:hypothetical protein